ncbi:hypothetical protein, partial [Halorubrum sp. Atlit-9R]|uniref:hypothetical protein n=1 Tax=Halorubrum sp. Atlit-9R TaxID=2282127 RepID=UPI001F344D16
QRWSNHSRSNRSWRLAVRRRKNDMSINVASVLFTTISFFIVLGIMALITVSIIVLIRKGKQSRPSQISSSVEIARDEEYRRLAESSYLIQQELKEGQDKIHDELTQLRVRINGMEKLLREVE